MGLGFRGLGFGIRPQGLGNQKVMAWVVWVQGLGSILGNPPSLKNYSKGTSQNSIMMYARTFLFGDMRALIMGGGP